MDPFPAPSNPLVHGERPPHSPGEGEENFEKKPVLKKVKDKVRKIKSTISQKARGHGGGDGDVDDNRRQQGDLDEGGEGYEEDEEMEEDPAVHGAPMYGSSIADARIGAMEIDGEGRNKGGGNSTAGVNEMAGQGTGGGYENTNTAAGAISGGNERGGTGIDGKDIISSAITTEFLEDPGAPNSSTRTKDKMGEKVEDSPELHRSLDAMVASEQNHGGRTEHSEDKNRSNDTVISSTEETGGEEGAVSPELHRSFNALSVSDQTGRRDAEVTQNKSSSYTDKISAAKDMAVSAASESAVLGKKVAFMVYDKASEAGTAVMAKVKTEPGKDGLKPEEVKDGEKPEEVRTGGDEAVGKQDKGVSMKDYVSGKLSPGEEDKALSDVITGALTPRKADAKEVAPPASSPNKSGSGEGGGGLGVVGKIKETVTSFLGGGGSPRGSSTAEAPPKEESKDFLGKTPEALSQEKVVQ